MIDIKEIREALPHRYPMLLVDRVLEVSEDEIVAIKNVSINEPFFNGHFPEYPVMPGVLIMEALAQTAGVLELSKEEKLGMPVDLLQVDMTRTWEILGEITGDAAPDELITQLFSQFCLGK